jgi:hypothetical protein
MKRRTGWIDGSGLSIVQQWLDKGTAFCAELHAGAFYAEDRAEGTCLFLSEEGLLTLESYDSERVGTPLDCYTDTQCASKDTIIRIALEKIDDNVCYFRNVACHQERKIDPDRGWYDPTFASTLVDGNKEDMVRREEATWGVEEWVSYSR